MSSFMLFGSESSSRYCSTYLSYLYSQKLSKTFNIVKYIYVIVGEKSFFLIFLHFELSKQSQKYNIANISKGMVEGENEN